MRKPLPVQDSTSATSSHLVVSKDDATTETGVGVVEELNRQHERVSNLLRCLDDGRWWSQSQPSLHADDVHTQVAIIKAALDRIDVSVDAMRGL